MHVYQAFLCMPASENDRKRDGWKMGCVWVHSPPPRHEMFTVRNLPDPLFPTKFAFYALEEARMLKARKLFKWLGDGTSRNNVSSCECSGTPCRRINRPLWHNVPGLVHPCHYALYKTFWLVQIGRDISMQGHCVSGTIHLGDQGSQNIHTGTHRFGTSCHPNN